MAKTKNRTKNFNIATPQSMPKEFAPVPVDPDVSAVVSQTVSAVSDHVPDAPGESEDEEYRAAVALNLCMVSLSQIVDYNDINILRMEYEAILNNINLECIPKDDALLNALQSILDTCHFFTLHEKNKELLKKKQALKLKAGLSNINFFVITGGGNPYAAAANLALMIGVAAVNYKTQKAKAEYENEAEEWELQKSALEQLHQLRGALFAAAWHLADKYKYKDEWRLSEKQIKLYDEILSDPDPLSRFNRLEQIQDKFEAYPIFFYYLAHAAFESTRDEYGIAKCDGDFKKAMYQKAEEALNVFMDKYLKAPLLREDPVAASAYLDIAEIEFEKEQGKLAVVLDAVKNAQRFAGFDFAILQNCVFQYLQIANDKRATAPDIRTAEEHAIECLKFLVSHNYNDINPKILSSLYVKYGKKADYDILYRLFSKRSIFPYRYILPWKNEDECVPDENRSITEDSVGDNASADLNYQISSYNDVLEVFFQSVCFRHILFKFFDGVIQTSFSNLLNALFKTMQDADSEPLNAYFKEPHERFYDLIWSAFIRLQKRFALNISYNSKVFGDVLKDLEKHHSELCQELDESSRYCLLNKKPLPEMRKDHRAAFMIIIKSSRALYKHFSLTAYYAGSFLFDLCQTQKLKKEDKIKKMFDLLDFLELETEKLWKNKRMTNPRFSYMSYKEFERFHKKHVEEYLFLMTNKLAKQGSAQAQYDLYIRFFIGLGVRKNEAAALEWLHNAAKQGCVEAQYDLFICYYSVKDYRNALEWLRKAAEQGYAEAQCKLSLRLFAGFEIEKDENAAIEWLYKSAEQGYAEAQCALGIIYYKICAKDKAAKWLRKASSQGYNVRATGFFGWSKRDEYYILRAGDPLL